ncbi:MAG: hypothetical protein N2482_00985 [Patescibacteria group bacterium]|nr:hypothetical protein [Patescibacteria group bacterium]
MIALAIYMVKKGERLTSKEKEFIEEPICSYRREKLTEHELSQVKKEIKKALRYIKPYNGPSRIWFAYQNSLTNGCRRLTKIISQLPVCLETTELIVKLLINLDRKLSTGGVDDSDGTVGSFIEATVDLLINYSKVDKNCLKAFKILKDKETSFGWEERLVKLLSL